MKKRKMNWAKTILFLSLLLPALVLAGNPCALDTGGGIGGTGNAQDGIGGTGLIDLRDGIGGTGRQAKQEEGVGDTDIVGVVTGFASICVLGIEVHYDDSTPVLVNGMPGSVDQLGVGQVVSINALAGRNGLVASQITVRHAVVGPLSRIDPVTGQFDVLGQTVQPAANVFRDARGQPAAATDLKPGMTVLVSGLRAPDGRILASRVEHITKPVKPHVFGALEHTAGVKRVIMQGIVQTRAGNVVRLDQGPAIHVAPAVRVRGGNQDDLVPGRIVKLSASLEHGTWHAEDLEFQHIQDLSRRAGSDRPRKDGHSGSGGHSARGSSDDHDTDDEDESRSGRDDGDMEKDDDRSQSGTGKSETIEVEKAEISGKSGRSDKTERIEKSGKTERVEKPEKIEKMEKLDRADRPDRSGRSRD